MAVCLSIILYFLEWTRCQKYVDFLLDCISIKPQDIFICSFCHKYLFFILKTKVINLGDMLLHKGFIFLLQSLLTEFSTEL